MAQRSTQVENAEQLAKGDNVLLGIALMMCFSLLVPFLDAMTKLLTTMVNLMTLLVIRYIIQLMLTLPLMAWHKGGLSHIWALKPATLRLLMWRTLMHIFSVIGMFIGLKYLPLADTVAIVFVFPIMMLITGYFFMGEQVGPHRLFAALFGFVGTLLVIQPNFIEVGLTVLWPIGVACSFVIYTFVTRQMSRDIDPLSVQAVSAVMAFPMLVIMFIFVHSIGLNEADMTQFELFVPDRSSWWLLLGVCSFGTFSHLLMTASLRYAPSATLAPMQYLEIPFATLIGWLIFSDLPNQLATIGIVITICAGLYIIYREQRRQR